MSDLISRQAAIDVIKMLMGDYELSRTVQTGLHILPSAQPERKKGKWVDKSGGIEGAWNYCSVCGEQAIDLYDFCPNCGADMREDDA